MSEFLGPTKMTLTVVNAGTQHNVIPDKCTMLVAIRTNEFYDNEEVYKFICQHLKSEVKAHSFRLKSDVYKRQTYTSMVSSTSGVTKTLAKLVIYISSN